MRRSYITLRPLFINATVKAIWGNTTSKKGLQFASCIDFLLAAILAIKDTKWRTTIEQGVFDILYTLFISRSKHNYCIESSWLEPDQIFPPNALNLSLKPLKALLMRLKANKAHRNSPVKVRGNIRYHNRGGLVVGKSHKLFLVKRWPKRYIA